MLMTINDALTREQLSLLQTLLNIDKSRKFFPKGDYTVKGQTITLDKDLLKYEEAEQYYKEEKKYARKVAYLALENECLGEGSFGKVYKAQYRLAFVTNTHLKQLTVKRLSDTPKTLAEHSLAVKITQERHTKSDFLQESIVRCTLEQNGLSKLYSSTAKPLVVDAKHTDLGDIQATFYAIGPFLKGKTLDALLKENLRNSHKLAIAKQIIDQLRRLHTKNCIHYDLKPANIMLDPHTKKANLFDINGSVAHSRKNHPRLGITKEYMAPEVTQNNTLVDTPVDIFSLGVIFLQLFAKANPTEFLEKLSEANNPLGNTREAYLASLQNQDNWPELSLKGDFKDEMKQLISDMLNTQPDKRPSTSAVFQRLEHIEYAYLQKDLKRLLKVIKQSIKKLDCYQSTKKKQQLRDKLVNELKALKKEIKTNHPNKNQRGNIQREQYESYYNRLEALFDPRHKLDDKHTVKHLLGHRHSFKRLINGLTRPLSYVFAGIFYTAFKLGITHKNRARSLTRHGFWVSESARVCEAVQRDVNTARNETRAIKP